MLGRAVSFVLEACMVHSGTIKIILQAEDFQVSSSSGLSGPYVGRAWCIQQQELTYLPLGGSQK